MSLKNFTTTYWNNIAEKTFATGLLKDNWDKRRGLVRHLLKYDMTNSKVLEIGCGLGLTAGMLKMIYGGFFHYTGTDISQRFCDIAKERVNLNTVCAYADNLPFPDNEFHCLFAFDVLEHIPPADKSAVYKELDRVLRKNAFVFINDPHQNNLCYHDEKVEHGFELDEIVKALGMEIIELSVYEGQPGYKYRFIVLQRISE